MRLCPLSTTGHAQQAICLPRNLHATSTEQIIHKGLSCFFARRCKHHTRLRSSRSNRQLFHIPWDLYQEYLVAQTIVCPLQSNLRKLLRYLAAETWLGCSKL